MMIGLDTNILVRYLTQDDPVQSPVATRLIETRLNDKEPGFISLVVLIELYWVLERLYGAEPVEIVETFADMLAVAQLQFQERESVQAALQEWRGHQPAKVQLPDVLIAQLALKFGCARIMSFDKAAARSAGMTLLV